MLRVLPAGSRLGETGRHDHEVVDATLGEDDALVVSRARGSDRFVLARSHLLTTQIRSGCAQLASFAATDDCPATNREVGRQAPNRGEGDPTCRANRKSDGNRARILGTIHFACTCTSTASAPTASGGETLTTYGNRYPDVLG